MPGGCCSGCFAPQRGSDTLLGDPSTLTSPRLLFLVYGVSESSRTAGAGALDPEAQGVVSPMGMHSSVSTLVFELFLPPPDAKGEGLGCCSLGFHGGRWVQILQLSQFPRVPPCPCTLLHSVPRLQSKVSYFCPLTALEAAELSKVILQLIWSLRCAAVVLPGRVSLGAGCCRYENVLSEVPEVRRRTP